MSRPRNLVPQPRNHKGSAVIDVTCGDGTRRTITLGPWRSAEAKTEYKRFLAEFAAGAYDRPARGDISVNEVLLAYLKHADQHYVRPDGSQTPEVVEYRQLAKLVRELYGHTPAAEFGPVRLKAVREVMIGKGWCRSLVNQRVNRLRHVFKWAVAEQLLPAAVHLALAAVAGLQRGRSKVRDAAPVGPVDDAAVDATLPHLNRYVRGLVEFQRLTGCRPGEACTVRRADIDTGGAVWLYRPAQHKTAWRGKSRVVAIGPKAQALLREFFTPDLDDYLFSARRAMDELRADRRAGRKTPVQPSQLDRRKRSPKKRPGGRYTPRSYAQALAFACDRAFPPPAPLAQAEGESRREWWARLTDHQRQEVAAWRKAHRWHPNQLRHTFATRIRKQHGLEAAQVLLGHARADVTQVYAEKNEALAVEIAAKLG